LTRLAAALLVVALTLGGCGGGAPGDSLGSNDQVFLLDRAGGDPRRVTDDGHDYTTPAWSPRGDRLAASFASGIAVFDRDGRRVKEFHVANVNDDASVAWSHDGRRLAFETTYDNPRTGSTDARLVVLDVATGMRRTLADVALGTPAWTVHDRGLIYLRGDLVVDTKPIKQELWMVDVAGGRPRRVARGARDDFPPQISRDGRRLLFSRAHSIWIARLDGSAPTRIGNRRDQPFAAWAPNDRDVVVLDYWRGGVRGFVLSPSGKRREVPGTFAAEELAWSPDGRVVAWLDEPGDGRLYIKAVRPDGTGGRVLARMAKGVVVGALSWSPDGRGLAFTASKPPPED
jgi:Tol biopolymer transport system component